MSWTLWTGKIEYTTRKRKLSHVYFEQRAQNFKTLSRRRIDVYTTCLLGCGTAYALARVILDLFSGYISDLRFCLGVVDAFCKESKRPTMNEVISGVQIRTEKKNIAHDISESRGWGKGVTAREGEPVLINMTYMSFLCACVWERGRERVCVYVLTDNQTNLSRDLSSPVAAILTLEW